MSTTSKDTRSLELSPTQMHFLQISPISDAYSLQSGHHPKLVLISQPLQEDNYAFWCRSMRLALSEKRKLGFIDGSLPKPDPTLNLHSLNLGNVRMILTLLRALSMLGQLLSSGKIWKLASLKAMRRKFLS
ncbi:hypothetical protein HN51_044204 [Arachis hypogaea]